jgi:chromosomal replication initiator protein
MDDNSNYETLWNKTMKQIKIQLDEQPFYWLSLLKFASYDDDEIIVSAASAYYQNQVKLRYLSLLEKIASELAGKPIKITIKLNAEKPHIKNSITPKPESVVTLPKNKHFQLKDDFTFGTFIVSDKNKYTFAAAQAVSQNPGKSYNPLLIYGGVGLGKTHLMQSIGNHVHSNYGNKIIIYISAENFMNEFIESINNAKSATSFRNKYRNADLLMIDDIHSFKNAEATLSELFNTYETLHNANKQMVFTCDRPVSELKNLTERLRSRFESGLNVEIQVPDYETRFAIIKSKIKIHNIDIPNDVISFICKNITSNVRDLLSALTKLFGYSNLMSVPITLEIAQQQLKDVITSAKQTNISVDTIINIVAKYFTLLPHDLKGRKRTKNIVHPRHLAMYLIRDLTELSTTDIGLAFCRDHTTVINAMEKIKNRILSDTTEELTIQTLKRTIRENVVK